MNNWGNKNYNPDKWDLSINKIGTKHGFRYEPEYYVWVGMKSRCNNKNHPKYYLYGGRGIKVCDEWVNSFNNFMLDMGNRPSNEYSLDRFPNQNGDYEKLNCRWATKLEQAGNLRSTKLLEYNGKIQSQAAWARELGISAITLRERLQKWTLERALSTGKLR